MMYGLYNNYEWGYGMMGGLVGGLVMVIFWALLIWLIIWAVKEVTGRHSNSSSKALDTLKERYAKGEISKEEFETKKKDIS